MEGLRDYKKRLVGKKVEGRGTGVGAEIDQEIGGFTGKGSVRPSGRSRV